MLVAYTPTPGLPAQKSASKPTPTHTQQAWAAILLFFSPFRSGISAA
jgi:hypothetical protein